MRLLVIAVLALSFLPCCNAENNEGGDKVAIQTVVAEVKTALADVQTRLANGALPPLKSVTLTLQTVASIEGGAKLNLWIVSLGHTWEKERSQEVVVELVPPSPGNPVNIATRTLTQELEDAIISAAEGVKGAETGKTPLKFNKLSVELKFTVKNDSKAGGKITIVPVTVELSGDLSHTAVHQLQLTFARPEKK